MRTIAFVCTWIVASAGAAVAGGDTAKGTFTSQGVCMEVKGAVAFRGTSFLDRRPVLIVAVSNARLQPEAIGDYFDRKLAIDRRLKDDETGVVYVEFRPDGRYHGISYYFASGNGCGFCTSEVSSTVKLVNHRLSGTLKGTEKDRAFELALDVPLLSDDHGLPLPPDGGLPGQAYLAYHSALVQGDLAALRTLISTGQQDTWARAEKKGELSTFLRVLAMEHPGKSVRISKGFATATTAVLLITGESSLGKLQGEVLLFKERDSWLIEDELTSL